MLTVTCVYWKGRFRGRERVYSDEWVWKLRNMVQRNLNIEHRFVCLSNADVPVDRIPLEHDWPGWWSKIELFRPGLFDDRVLYLDLDVMVMQNMDKLVQWPHYFALIGTGAGKQDMCQGKEIVIRYNTSVMVFEAGQGDVLYKEFAKHPGYWMSRFRGDQDYIGYQLPHLEDLPHVWTEKFRWLKNKNKKPDDDIIILLCMSGREGKTHRLVKKYKWMRKIWQ